MTTCKDRLKKLCERDVTISSIKEVRIQLSLYNADKDYQTISDHSVGDACLLKYVILYHTVPLI